MVTTNAQESLEAYEKYFLVDQGELDDIQQQKKVDDKYLLQAEAVKQASQSIDNIQNVQQQDSIDDNDLVELGSNDDPGD